MLRFDIATQADVMPGEEFRLTDIAPGKYRLAAVSNYGPTVSTYFLPVEVKAGETIKVADLKSPEKVQEFSGRPKKDTRGGFESPRLVALLGPCVSMASVRPDGTFEGQAPPGKYRVYYSSFSTLMLKRELSEAGEIVIEEGKDLTGIEIP
jgi:hypothetical protein